MVSKNTKKVIMGVILAAVLIAAVYASFAFLLITSDRASYRASGKTLGKIDYDMVISSAKNAGYIADGPFYVNSKEKIGLQPSGIGELDERLGEEYRVLLVKFYYRDDSFFEVTFPRAGETTVFFFNEIFLPPVKLTDLPDDEWIIEKFGLMFGLNDQKARNYLTQLKESITRGQEPKILIKEALNFPAVYNNLKKTSTNSTFSLPLGEGWCRETFYKENKTTGAIDYVVPSVKIIHQDKGHEYTIHIDRLGGVDLKIELNAGEKIPEEEYRGVFKEMFASLGLPPESVSEFEFKYVPGNW